MISPLILLLLLLASPAWAVQDWATRRSQPGVVLAVKAGERLVMPVVVCSGTDVCNSTSATTLHIDAWPTGWPTSSFYVSLDKEVVSVTGGFGTTTLTVARAQDGTTAVTHVSGTGVTVTNAANAVWTTESNINFWKKDDALTTENYWQIWSQDSDGCTGCSLLVTFDNSIYTSLPGSFRQVLPGDCFAYTGNLVCGSFSYKGHWFFTGPPLYARRRAFAFPSPALPYVNFDAGLPSGEWTQSSGKGFKHHPALGSEDGSEFWIQYRVRYGQRLLRSYAGGGDSLDIAFVTNMSWAGGLVTVTLDRPHNFPASTSGIGPIVIWKANPSAYDTGPYGVFVTSTGTNTFTYPLATNPGTFLGQTGTGCIFQTSQPCFYKGAWTIQTLTCNAGLVTVTTSSQHTIPINDAGQGFAVIWGVTPSVYNNNGVGVKVTSLNGTQFTYNIGTCPGAYVSGGQVFRGAGDVSPSTFGAKLSATAYGNTGNMPAATAGSGDVAVAVNNFGGITDGGHMNIYRPYMSTYGVPQTTPGDGTYLLGTPTNAGCLKHQPGQTTYPEATCFYIPEDTWHTVTEHHHIGHWLRGDSILGWRRTDQGSRGYYQNINQMGNLTLTASTKTLTRTSGSYVTDGFTVGAKFFLADSLHSANTGFYTVATVAATTLTVNETMAADTVDNVGYLRYSCAVDVTTAATNNFLPSSLAMCWNDADLLPADPVTYPGNTGLPRDPGPITHIAGTTATVNVDWFLTAKQDATHWTVKDSNGNPPAVTFTFHTDKAQATGWLRAARQWRDSTIQLYMAFDGQPRQLISQAGYSDFIAQGATYGAPKSFLADYWQTEWGMGVSPTGAPCCGSNGYNAFPDGAMVGALRFPDMYQNFRLPNTETAFPYVIPTTDGTFWYDEILISTQDIADPTAAGSGSAPLLTVTRDGTGSGTVTSADGNINCGGTCSSNYTSGTFVTLTATASSGSSFSGWSGCDAPSGATCVQHVLGNSTVDATFIRIGNTLTVTKTGSGTGTVTSNPAGINCGPTCASTFADPTSIVLTATADAGSIFASWTNCPTPSGNTCSLTLTGGDATVTATFTAVNPTITINKTGTGTGTVSSSPVGLNCGATCSFSFSAGTLVVLTATPAPTSAFVSWTGCPGPSGATCSFTITADISITAAFTLTGTAGNVGRFGRTVPSH